MFLSTIVRKCNACSLNGVEWRIMINTWRMFIPSINNKKKKNWNTNKMGFIPFSLMIFREKDYVQRLQEIKSVNPKGNKSWIFIIRIDAEAEVSVLRPPDAKSQLIGKDPDAGKDWRQDRKGMTEDEMVGWHHWLNGQEFDLAPGDSEGQGSLACCSPWGCQQLDTAEQLKSNKRYPSVYE